MPRPSGQWEVFINGTFPIPSCYKITPPVAWSNHMNSRTLLAVAVSAALVGASAFAQVERQHAPHVHGIAVGSLALDDGDLRLELEIPGVNLVGFEHAPRTDQQQAALDDALDFLRAADWLQADPRGGCELASINAHTHGFNDGGDDYDHEHHHDHGHDNGHEHHHDHGHDDGHGQAESHDHTHDHKAHHGNGHDDDHHHDHGNGHSHDHDHDHDHDHAEFHIVVQLECDSPDRLGWLDLRLFEDFPGNERMDIDVLTETVATQARLMPGNERINLQ
ncbi:MAG: DUF2796 domain-containing protein [Wenzhouxiangella sp.]|nr:MAG: DUF2796 domain-containing protein [Wenzhouxiangella sp.]